MIWLRYLPTMIAAGALAGAVWYVVSLRAENAALAFENASLSRSVAALEDQAEQARLAADVARAETARVAGKAREYDKLKETLLRGNEDAPLPNWFRDYLDALFGGGIVRPAD